MPTNTGAGCTNPDPSAYGFMLGSQNVATGSWNLADYTPPAVDHLLAAGLKPAR